MAVLIFCQLWGAEIQAIQIKQEVYFQILEKQRYTTSSQGHTNMVISFAWQLAAMYVIMPY